MLGRLFLLFTVLTFTEMFLLVKLATLTSFWVTIAIVLLTGMAGAWLARREGFRVWRDAQARLAQGEIPADAVLDGLAILLAGAFLMTPGLITDTMGFLLLLPPVRALVRGLIAARFQRMLDQGTATFVAGAGRRAAGAAGLDPEQMGPFGTAGSGAGPFAGGPFGAGPMGGNPFGGSPFGGSPFGGGPRDLGVHVAGTSRPDGPALPRE